MTVIDGMTGERIDPPAGTFRKPTAYDTGHDALAGSGDLTAISPPPRRSKFEAVLSPYLPDQYRQRPDWHRLVCSVSAAAHEAGLKLDREVDGLQAALDALDDLPPEQQAEAREIEKQVADALDAGRQPKMVKPTDWEGRKVTLEAEARARLTRCQAARTAYAGTVQAELEPARAVLAATLEGKRDAALEALRSFEPAVRDYTSTLSALDMIAGRIDPEDVSGCTTAEARRVRAAGAGSLGALVAMLTSDDAVVSGSRHLDRSGLRVPLHTRRAWAQGSEADVARLAEVEALDDQPAYSVTCFTLLTHAQFFRRGA